MKVNTRSAYVRTNCMRHVVEKTVMSWKIGSARKRRSQSKNSEQLVADLPTAKREGHQNMAHQQAI
jgi:hypothetical protein